MKNYLKVFGVAIFAMSLFSIAHAQNRFEGSNLVLSVPEDQKSTACALRYVPPSTDIKISDLDPQTPMKLTPCGGDGSTLTQTSPTTATVRASPVDHKWCFQGEDKRYRISFTGDRYTGSVSYDWIATPDARTRGIYNVRDFGAVGDGTADDTFAIRSALAFVASRNGGILFFPEGDYHVGREAGFRGLTLPSGITIQGVSGLHSGAATNNINNKNPTRITLEGPDRDLFRIGECTEKVAFKDIELLGLSQQTTVGIHALGAYNSSQDFDFENVTFSTFWRGIYAHGLPQTDLSWQFDYVHIDRCRFAGNTDAGIYTNTRNSDWRVQNSLFLNPARTANQRADSMYFAHAAGILVDNTTGGGFSQGIGGTFLNVLDSANILVSHSGTENMTNSFVYNEINHPAAGDYSWTMTFLNSAFGDPIIFNARRTFISVGNAYGPNTFKADERLRVYSTGDRFCFDGYILGCRGAENKSFDRATVVFMTGQPSDGQVPGFPAIFGTDVQFNNPIKLPSFQQNALPQGKADGSLVYCANCRRSSTPCQSGGTGAPAMMVAGNWSCL